MFGNRDSSVLDQYMANNVRKLAHEGQESELVLAGGSFQNRNATANFGSDSPVESTPLELLLAGTNVNDERNTTAEREPHNSTVRGFAAEVSTAPVDATHPPSLAHTSQRFAVSCVDLSRLISTPHHSKSHNSSPDVAETALKRLEQGESGTNGRPSGRVLASHWATAPLPPANAPTGAAPRVPPFPMLGAIRAKENILAENEDAPHRPGYATPMRTSVVELFPTRGSSADVENEDDISVSPPGPHSPTHVNFPSSGNSCERLYASRFDAAALSNNSPSSSSPLSDSDSCTTDSFDSLHDGSSFFEGSRHMRPSTNSGSRKLGSDSSSPGEHSGHLHSPILSSVEHHMRIASNPDTTSVPKPHTFGDMMVAGSSPKAGERLAFQRLPASARVAPAASAASSNSASSRTAQAPNSTLDTQCQLLPGHDHVFGTPASSTTATSPPARRPVAQQLLGASPSGSPTLTRNNIEQQAPTREFAITSRNTFESGASAFSSKKNTPAAASATASSGSGLSSTPAAGATPNALLSANPDRPASNTHSSAVFAPPQATPPVLMQKPKLVKHRSALDSLTSTSPPSTATHNPVPIPLAESAPKKVNDPFEDMVATAELPWGDIVFDTAKPCLGDGNEGDVLLARVRNNLVAVKMGDHKRILKEQKMISGLSHPHVLRTMGFSKRDSEVIAKPITRFESADAELMYSTSSSEEAAASIGSTPSPVPVLRPAGSYAAIYEYCANKDLMTYLSVSDARTDVNKMTQIFDDILAGLEYIHDPKRTSDGPIVHGDVKPENIMIDHSGRAKLGDFGLAQTQSTHMDVQGTPSYIAPEVVLDFLAASPHPNFTTKADMFSFGVLMVVALTGHYPFKRLTAKLHSCQMSASQVIKHFTPSRRALKTISDLSPRFKRMVDSCLCRYPEMRPNASQLRNMLYRRAKPSEEEQQPRATGSRAEVGKIPIVSLEPSTPAGAAAAAADYQEDDKLPSILDRYASPAASMATKVPASLAHLVLGPSAAAAASTPPALIAIPVSSGKFSD